MLSQDNQRLAVTEASHLLCLKHCKRIGSMLLADVTESSEKKIRRLAYTKKTLRVLFKCRRTSLKKMMESYDFSKIYKESFSLRIHSEDNKRPSESEYAGYIWRNIEKKGIRPYVNLSNPKTPLEIILHKDKTYCAILEWENSEDFESRKAHLSPAPHPTGMNPKMARALVNILNENEITDLFCGSGGILIEAGLMGIKSRGYDIDESMIRRARVNLEYNGVKKNLYILKRSDATRIKKAKNIVTDLPYGKSSHASEELTELYSKFVRNIIGKAVIVFPSFSEYKRILRENLRKNLRVYTIIDQYIHKTLTRKIVVIGKHGRSS